VVTRAADAIGDLPMQGAVSRPRALAQQMAGRIQRTSLAAEETSNPPIFWQAGMLLTGTVTAGSLCDAAYAISDRAVPDRIRAIPKVVFATVTVPPSST
jgi:hypothetical protein